MCSFRQFSLLTLTLFLLTSSWGQEGLLDPSFGSGGKVIIPISTAYDSGYGIAVQSDGKIVVAGEALNGTTGDNYDVTLVRLQPDGNVDPSFGGSGAVIATVGPGWDLAGSVLIQPDGKIVVAGQSNLGGATDFIALRFLSDGSLDTGFGNNGIVRTALAGSYNYGWYCALQPDGKILVTGPTHNGTNLDFGMVRLQPNGSLDQSFGNGGKVITALSNGDDYSWSCALQPDGKILLAGNSPLAGSPVFALARYHANGSLDTGFGDQGKVRTPVGPAVSRGRSVAVQSDGKILLGGSAGEGSAEDLALVRYLADGSLDPSFGNGGIVISPAGAGEDKLWKVLVQPDGKILASGYALGDQSGFDFAVLRYRPDGTPDTDFGDQGIALIPVGPGNDFGIDIALQSDGKIVMTGAAVDLSYDLAVVRLENSFFSGTFEPAGEASDFYFFPNPFHSTANLSFQLMQAERVRVLLYDPLGRKVRTLLEETLPPGEFERAIDLKGFPGGLYYLHLQTDSTEQVIRVLHLY